MKRLLCMLLTCMIAVGYLPILVSAAEVPAEDVVWQDDLKWEQVDLSAVKCLEYDALLRTSTPVNGNYSAYTISAVSPLISLGSRSMVTFNCSYSPSSASMDFGVIDSNGRFYYINVKEGSISQTIRISQSGSYQVAIRNNSSQTVSVVGFVEY